MKKILLSVMTIALVATAGIAATRAYFTDTESSVGNTFTAGTIDIAVDDQNPWSRTTPYQLVDMKPSQVDYTNFVITNVGTNPANVWKKVANVATSDEVQSEPECVEANGTWSGTSCTGGTPKNDIDTVIDYDLSVKVYNAATGGTEIFNQTLYNKDKTISQIKETNVFLGMIPEGGRMEVTESYHMQSATTNWAQGDKMTFDIVLTAEQLKGVAILENKSNDGLWQVLGGDSYTGTFTYGVKDSKLTYTLTGKAPLASTPYSLIVYHEPWSTPAGSGWPRPVTVLGTAVSDGSGDVSIASTSVELNGNLLNAKVWLVKSSDLTGNTMSGWNHSAYLFDTGLIDYYDSDL